MMIFSIYVYLIIVQVRISVHKVVIHVVVHGVHNVR
jgi:hypothetical protein